MSEHLITASAARQRRNSYVVNKRNRLTKEDARLVNEALKCIGKRIYYESKRSHKIYFNDHEYFSNAIEKNKSLNNLLWYLQKAEYYFNVIELVDYKQIIIRW